MELVWLQDFLALSNEGSFSRAAKQRNVTQPAFSRRIHALEQWIGAKLFDRSTHPVSLTYIGDWFRPIADELVHRILTTREEAKSKLQDVPSTLYFASTHALSWSFFPTWLFKFEDRMSRGQLGPTHLISDTLNACEELMIEGSIQFVLCHYHPNVPNRLKTTDFQSVQVGQDVIMPVAAPSVIEKVEQLGLPNSGAQLLSYSRESGLGQIVRGRRSSTALKVLQSEFSSHLAVVLKSMALDARGIAWLPKTLIQDELRTGALQGVGLDLKSIPVEMHLFRRRSPESARAEAFWKLLLADREAAT